MKTVKLEDGKEMTIEAGKITGVKMADGEQVIPLSMVRQIVREEIAAHEERLTLDGEKIAEALGEHLRKRRKVTGETWLDDTP